jgi:hypothetical protein
MVFFLTLLLSMGAAVPPAQAQLVRISNLVDVSVPNWVTGGPDIIHDLFVCVYRQNVTDQNRRYAIRAVGDGPGLALRSGFHQIPFTAIWNDGGVGNPAGGTAAPLLHDVKLLSRNNARIQTDLPRDSTDCQGYSRPTARLRLVISRTALDAAYDGVYTGVLVLMLTPE